MHTQTESYNLCYELAFQPPLPTPNFCAKLIPEKAGENLLLSFFLRKYECSLSHMQTLYGLYIADGCDRNIDCPASVSSSVSSNLCPAYDDLFDAVEEHALSMLLLPWLELCHSEDSTFQEVCIIVVVI